MREVLEEILIASFEANPRWAYSLGRHEYAGRLGDVSRGALDRRARELSVFRQRLLGMDIRSLPSRDRLDREILLAAIDKELFELLELRRFECNPLVYARLLDLTPYLKPHDTGRPSMIAAVVECLRQIPGVLIHARRNLVGACSRPHVSAALEMFEGLAAFLRHDLPQTLAISPVLSDSFTEAHDSALAAVQGFAEHLRTVRDVQATEEFRLGTDRYPSLLWAIERVDTDVDLLQREGEEELERVQERFVRTAEMVSPGHGPSQAIRLLAQEHPPADALVAEARRCLSRARQFVLERQIVSIPDDDDSCIVEPAPPFLRLGFAMLEPTGPFDSPHTPSKLYINVPDPAWPRERAEGWLARLNWYALENLAIHEGYPGHHVHFLHLRTNASPIAKAFWSYAFIEGWAHYAEDTMLNEGYGADAPKLRLVQLHETLVRVVRYLVAIGLHAGAMTLDEARRRFVEDAYLEQPVAQAEAQRTIIDPMSIRYTLGRLFLDRLLAAAKAGAEDAGTKRWRERLLALGAPPLGLIPIGMRDDDVPQNISPVFR